MNSRSSSPQVTAPAEQQRFPRLFPRLLGAAPTAALVSAGFLAGCNSTDSPELNEIDAGTYVTSNGNQPFFADSNFGGRASEFRISRQFYGRLVSVAAFDDLGRLRVIHDEFVIDPKREIDWQAPYELTTNRVNGSQTLVINVNIDDTTPDGGFDQFVTLLSQAEGGVRPVSDIGFIGAGNYTMVPRNAAFVLQFDDLIDATTINQSSIRVLTGDPTIVPYAARIFADPNHGGLADFDGSSGSEFYSTRVIIDPSISSLESLATGIPANLLGLPPSANQALANVEVRIPTRQLSGQIAPILQNPTEHPLTTSNNGTSDFGTQTNELVRAFRSGGSESVTGDPFSGFLPDGTPPSLVGSQGALVSGTPMPVSGPDPFLYTLPSLQFNSTVCARAPRIGDIIVIGEASMEVQADRDVSAGGLATGITVRLLQPLPPSFNDDPGFFVVNGEGPAQYIAPYTDSTDNLRPQCFVTVSPTATGFPLNPNLGIPPSASFTLRFSEAINPDRLEPYESFRLTRERETPEEFADYVPGTIRGDLNLQQFTFDPLVDLSHEPGSSESYFLSFPDDLRIPRDLAGNPVTDQLTTIEFTVDMDSPESRTGGRVSLFNDVDEEFPFSNPTDDDLTDDAPIAEWWGQINYDFDLGRVRPRPVVRSQLFVSGFHQVPAAMQTGVGTTLPLNPLGARTQFMWRYCDFGLPLYDDGLPYNGLDTQNLNVDIEGVYLSPLGSNPVFSVIPEFAMNMTHSAYLPDEEINPFNMALIRPTSGFDAAFNDNLFDEVEDPYQEVHPREEGYTINPGDQTLAADGTTLIPLPMNQGVPEGQKRYYTWRDTALTGFAGERSGGAPPQRVLQVTGEGPFLPFVDATGIVFCDMQGGVNPVYLPGQIRTAALPILLDFRAYANNMPGSSNLFVHNNAHTTTAPFFRAFSSGGLSQSGEPNLVDPDAENIANGGFDPTSTPPGANIPGRDNTVYFGAIDLVVRVSRAYSIFFPAVNPFSFNDAVNDPITNSNYALQYDNSVFVEPIVFPEVQPQGTSVELAYRGSDGVGPQGLFSLTNASQTDPYGDYYPDLPYNYQGGDEQPMINIQGGASCFDGSFAFNAIDTTGAFINNPGVGFLNDDRDWKRDIAQISGATFFQVRVSFLSNPSTAQTPEIASMGFAWSGQ